MENKAADLVTRSLLGERFVTVVLKGGAYTVYPPTIKVLLRAIKWFSNVDVPDKCNRLDALLLMPENIEKIIMGLSYVIAGDGRDWEEKALKVHVDLKESTLEELKTVFSEIISLIHVDDFFDCAALAKSIAKMAAQPR